MRLREIATGQYVETVHCPVCEDANLHILRVEIEQEDFKTVVTYNHHAAVPIHQGARGSVVAIHFLGECGHGGALAFRFHKGATYCDWTAAEPMEWGPDVPAELWRD